MSAALVIGLVAFGVVVGGGTLIVPFLVLVAGLTQHEAQATSLLAILPTSIVATVVLQRRGVGDLRLSLVIGCLGIVGALAGSALALALPADVLQILFAVFLGLIGLRMVRDGRRALRDEAVPA